MSMTSEGVWPRRPMNLTSLRNNMGGRFAAFMQSAGLPVPRGVSMTGLGLLRDVVAAGGTLAAAKSSRSARASGMKEPAPGMGLLIKHGFARFVPAERHYEITAEGRALLERAGQTGVLAKLAEFEGVLREAVRNQATDAAQRVPTNEGGIEA